MAYSDTAHWPSTYSAQSDNYYGGGGQMDPHAGASGSWGNNPEAGQGFISNAVGRVENAIKELVDGPNADPRVQGQGAPGGAGGKSGTPWWIGPLVTIIIAIGVMLLAVHLFEKVV
jgi:hypothetical protein